MSDKLSAGTSLSSSLNVTAGTSMCMSIRSSRGPDIFETYRWICIGEHLQSRVGSLKKPHGQGFIAAASMNRDGNVNDIEARLIVTLPSSSGCLNTSSTFLSNSGSSSKNNNPLCASDTSPGLGIAPPPIKPASEIVWCGDRKGRVLINPYFSVSPTTLWIFVDSRASSNSKGGRIVGIRFASIVFPEPGGPIS